MYPIKLTQIAAYLAIERNAPKYSIDSTLATPPLRSEKG